MKYQPLFAKLICVRYFKTAKLLIHLIISPITIAELYCIVYFWIKGYIYISSNFLLCGLYSISGTIVNVQLSRKKKLKFFWKWYCLKPKLLMNYSIILKTKGLVQWIEQYLHIPIFFIVIIHVKNIATKCFYQNILFLFALI